jgi:predicted metalloprotease with PDZ domain
MAAPPTLQQGIVDYHVSLAARAAHLYDVEARFPVAGAPAELELRLPVWTPGSYLIREYARHLQGITVVDDEERPLPVRKVGKAAWRVRLGDRPTASVRARYRVYAHEVSVRTSHLDASHAFWNGATLFLYVEEQRALPARVTVDAPPGWEATCGLERDPERPLAFRAPAYDTAPDYDTLVDCPVEIGPHERVDFTAAGAPHALAIWGRGAFDRQKLVDDVTAIVEAQARLFGGVPYARYAFLVHLVPGGYGGLEHKNSATVLASPFGFAPEKKYQELLELLSHEFFHLWNGKRIRPEALGPFDYAREAHTRSLWVVEGWTSYYDRLFLRRAGRMSAARWLEKLGEDLTKLARTPGRAHQSVEESSFDAWIKLYRPDENSVNTTVSYYLKGSVVALLLDLEIRRRTQNARTLDDALRLLWHETERTGRGYADDALQPLVEEAAGVSLDDFFAHAVRGRGELDLEAPLATVGLRLERRANGGGGGAGAATTEEQPWLGVSLAQTGDRLKVTEVLEGGPAAASHLYAGDEIVALEGFRVDETGLKDRLGAFRPGDTVRLHVFRRDELRELPFALGRRPLDKIEVVPNPNASPSARAAYLAWLGESFPS